MKTRVLYFAAPGQIELREEMLPPPAPGECLIETLVSAISPGTELLIYRGQFPAGLSLDTHIDTLSGAMSYPVKYGYACVGRVLDTGTDIDPVWRDRTVFAFHPHQSHFLADPAALLPVPDDISPAAAAFLPNVETAINFIHDGAPLIGERVLVLGQGIVGLLTTTLLTHLPLAVLVTADRYPDRRQVSLAIGADVCIDASSENLQAELAAALDISPHYSGADLVFELSGNPAALNTAIAVCGYNGRVIIGSWYGQKQAAIDLGGTFHRSRIRLISSQVSTIDPRLRGRWTSARRYVLAWSTIRAIQPERFISHHRPVDEAADAFDLLDQHPDQCIQVMLTYGDK